MKIKREKLLALIVGTCMALTLCMGSFVTTVSATGTIVETGYISHNQLIGPYVIHIPSGPEVKVTLMWDEPKHDVIDLDFFVAGYGWIGGSFRNPEIAYLGDFPDDTDLYVWLHGWYVPVDSVEYTLEITYGSDLIPDPYAESGGLTVGDLTSFHNAARRGVGSSDKQGAPSWSSSSNPARQAIMPLSFWFELSPLYFGLMEFGGWVGPAYCAGDALFVGGMAWAWSMIDYTREEAEAEMELLNVQYKIDDIPLEELGHTTDVQIRPDLVAHQWYYRWPAAIFSPYELYNALPYHADGIHTFQLSYFDLDDQVAYELEWLFYLL